MAIEILTIGTELLLGDILDTNARAIALALRESGLDLHWISTVGDNASRIAQSLRLATSRAEGVITTGGLGPTVDDPTREAAAEAFGLPLEFRPELWEGISARMSRWGRAPTENNRRQAFLPRGALPIENPVGTAPGFIVETSSSAVLSLPGVPREMEHMLNATVIPYLREKSGAPSLIRSTVLHLVGLGESQIDDRVGDLERLSNPTVGLAAHSGIIDVRITAKGNHPDQVQSALTRIASEVRRRLPEAVFGQDDETLEEDILARLAARALRLATVEWGTGGKLSGRLGATQARESYSAGLTLPGSAADLAEVKGLTQDWGRQRASQWTLGLSVRRSTPDSEALIVIASPEGVQETSRLFSGPPASAERWGVNVALYLLWKNLGANKIGPGKLA
ncbi:MAG: CinA family nicotinamide mononucleotide deamidase-related protein [Anaerolineales bacterium]|jgi:competence/damage-inducible protein CinA-like protein